jgi:YidC/Oxa1 family membrane protein insertase
MNNQKNNMILAFALAALVLFAWQYFVATPAMKAEQARQAELSKQQKAEGKPIANAPGAPSVPGMAGGGQHVTRDAALKAGGARVAIDTPMLDGSILLRGAKFDDLRLKQYRETPDPKSPEIVLLAPKSTDYPYYAMFGWTGDRITVPDDRSEWQQTGGGTLSPGHPVTLSWDNGRGLVFTRIIAIDDRYMFTVADSVSNRGGAPVTLYPYAYVAREGVPQHEAAGFALHLGFVGVVNNALNESSYDDFKNDGTPPKAFSSSGGWLGITDKYWMAAVVPPQNETYNGEYLGTSLNGGTKAYQANYRLNARNIAPGASVNVSHRLFAGAKVVDILRDYEDRQQIARFDLAVDWGWFWFLTRPFFWLLDSFNKFLGNFGLAILLLTVVVKIAFFPLANVSYRSMAKMKKVQPQMEAIKKAHEGDPQKQQQEIMEMYRREKVNPLAGCLPILLTIPVFFSLYKVLFVTIEMRQAPFYGWIRDLSMPDPTSYLNLFGLLPFNPHAILPSVIAFLSVGVWPIIYGVTQWFQTKLNPAPADPVQAKMFAFMPIIFTFMFATFPAGLVIYYAWNNVLSVAQQWFIMSRDGVKVNFFENIKGAKAKPANDR